MNNIFRVIKVNTFIRDKINFIQLHLDKKYINYVTSTNKQNEILQFPFDKKNEKLLGISLLEVELLVGYDFIPVFFMPGETLPNGKIAKENNSKYYIKAWKTLSVAKQKN